MDLVIQARNVELNEEAKTYIHRKLARVGRHLPSVREAVVEIARESARNQEGRMVAQITMNVNGTILRGEQRAATFKAAVDALADVADRRVARYKGRIYRTEQARRSARRTLSAVSPGSQQEGEPAQESVPTRSAEEEGRVVRVKRFPVERMSTEDAIQQMELLGHDFFLFVNSADGLFTVVYHRHSGDYGLLQPQSQ